MSDFLSWFRGGDAPKYSNRFAGQSQGAISQLSNSNFGAQEAQTAERAIGKRYQDTVESIDSDPNFGRNAAVSSRLRDNATESAGFASANAYTKGAEVDANARVQAAQLGNQAAQTDLDYDKMNYQSEQDHSFGNSFLGHVLQAGVGAGLGYVTGGLGGGQTPAPRGRDTAQGTGIDYDADNAMGLADAQFGRGKVKAIIGQDGKTYLPRPDDKVVVGTNLPDKTNTKLAAGTLGRVKLNPPHTFDFHTAKLGHNALDFAT